MGPEIIPTIIICVVLAAVVALAIISIVRDRKKGKSCGCGCENCAMSGTCHAAKNNTENKNTPDTKSEEKSEN